MATTTTPTGQRRLFHFSLLCLGAVGLLAGWCAVALVATGMAVMAFGAWMWLALLIAILLLLLGLLVIPYMEQVRYGMGGPVVAALVVLLVTALGALVCATITAGVAGPMIYHAHYGERTDALVTEAKRTENEDGNRVGTTYHLIEYATERDLGWMQRGPRERAAEGDRLEVSVDPHGWVDPVAADRLGYTGVPTAILVCCLAAVALATLGVVGAALYAW